MEQISLGQGIVLKIVNASSCAGCTVRPNKLKHQSLEQRKVYCKTLQGYKVAHALKSLELPEEFQQSIFFFKHLY